MRDVISFFMHCNDSLTTMRHLAVTCEDNWNTE